VSLVVNAIPAPAGLTATVISTTQINLSWVDNSGGAYGFLIERAPDNGGATGPWRKSLL